MTTEQSGFVHPAQLSAASLVRAVPAEQTGQTGHPLPLPVKLAWEVVSRTSVHIQYTCRMDSHGRAWMAVDMFPLLSRYMVILRQVRNVLSS